MKLSKKEKKLLKKLVWKEVKKSGVGHTGAIQRLIETLKVIDES